MEGLACHFLQLVHSFVNLRLVGPEPGQDQSVVDHGGSVHRAHAPQKKETFRQPVEGDLQIGIHT